MGGWLWRMGLGVVLALPVMLAVEVLVLADGGHLDRPDGALSDGGGVLGDLGGLGPEESDTQERSLAPMSRRYLRFEALEITGEVKLPLGLHLESGGHLELGPLSQRRRWEVRRVLETASDPSLR